MTYAERVIWKREFYRLHIPVVFDHRIECIERVGNRVSATFRNLVTDDPLMLTGDQVIVEHGTVPADELYRALRSRSSNGGVTDIDALLARAPQPRARHRDGVFELHRVGDAVASRNIHAAILDSLRLCMAA